MKMLKNYLNRHIISFALDLEHVKYRKKVTCLMDKVYISIFILEHICGIIQE